MHRLLIIAIVQCAACTVTGIDSAGPRVNREGETMRAYTERVFRLQNRVIDEVMTQGELGNDVDPTLERIETRIATSCRHLNESAALYAMGKEPPMALRINVLETVEECEDAAMEGADVVIVE